MTYLLLIVMTLISVHVHAEIQTDNLTLADFNETTTPLQDSLTDIFNKNGTISGTSSEGIVTESPVTTDSDYTTNGGTTNSMINREDSTKKAVITTATDSKTEEVVNKTTTVATETPNAIIPNITYAPDIETLNLTTESDLKTPVTYSADEVTNYPQTNAVLPDSLTVTTEKIISGAVKNATEINGDSQTYLPSTDTLHLQETTEIPSPENFFKWLDSIHPENVDNANTTEKRTRKNETDKYENTGEIDNGKQASEVVDSSVTNIFDPDKMPPREFLDWLNSIHPDFNDTDAATVPATNIIDTSIISTEKLIIVISTICGTFVLFVAILIAISCCRRQRNLRNDSEKSDFSVTSVVSVPDKRKSDSFSTDKNGFNNLFMGIPANNEVWKNLEQLSPADSSILPESTKM